MRREEKERKRQHEQRQGGGADQQRKGGMPQHPLPGQPDRFSKDQDDEKRGDERFERGDETSQRPTPRPNA